MRKERVEQKLLEIRRREEGTEHDAEEKKDIPLSKAKVISALRAISVKRAETSADVSSQRVVCLERERERREHEESRRAELAARIADEAQSSAQANAVVANNWGTLYDLDVPQDLFKAVQEQKQACQRIVDSKDALITDMRTELKAKDDSYVLALKDHTAEIDAMLEAMSREFAALMALYNAEGEEVGAAYLTEQGELLAEHEAEIKSLLAERKEKETAFQEKTLERVEEYHQRLEDLRMHQAEEYNQLRVRMTQDILNLERHMQAMTATFHLNQEKLEYNYRVLSEREHENSKTRDMQKRKKHRMIDVLSHMKQRYHELDRKAQEDNTRLTDEYKRITELFKDLQKKFMHFEEADFRTYQEVWAHKDQLVADLVRRVLEADKIIHEQQLGLGWRPPPEEIFVSPWEKVATEVESGAKDEQNQAKVQAEAAQALEDRVADPTFGPVLALLEAEAGYLVPVDTKKPMTAEVRLAKIFDALGVVNGETFDRMVDALTVPYGSRASSSKANEKDKEAAVRVGSDRELVSAESAAGVLKAFVERFGNDARNIKAKPGAGSRAQVMTKRMMEREREYWTAMAHVVSDKGVRVWSALESGLQKYHKLLTHRSQDLESTQSLMTQNQELRALLGQYLSSKANAELQLAPAQIL